MGVNTKKILGQGYSMIKTTSKIAQGFSVVLFLFVISTLCFADTFQFELDHAQGEMAGEPTQSSIILQSRLTSGRHFIDGDIPGASGVGCFEVSESLNFEKSFKTKWCKAVPENDYIIKQKVNNLRSGRHYYYRLLYGPDTNRIKTGDTCTFKTLDGPDAETKVTFVVVTGMCYFKFYTHYVPHKRYQGQDRYLGYPTLDVIGNMAPDFFVATGDNVYYDEPVDKPAQTQQQLRQQWHEQFVQPRFVKLFAQIPTYWEKDDHDLRYNDCDNTGDKLPTMKLGIKTFLEQVPVVDPDVSEPITYRTHRVNKLLQIWFVEGRDYRSPNKAPDGPEKTIWGKKQKQWLKRTLLESTAKFKILISPTPMIGPDDAFKSDNHGDPKGFKYEGDKFFQWLGQNGFLKKHFYVVCGDRHWKYHSIHHPSGFEEFSCGALTESNSRLARKPGDPNGTDPQSLIKQPYVQEGRTGGFLTVTVEPGSKKQGSRLCFDFYDHNGNLLYTCEKF